MGTWFWDSYGTSTGGSWMRRATCSSTPGEHGAAGCRSRAQRHRRRVGLDLPGDHRQRADPARPRLARARFLVRRSAGRAGRGRRSIVVPRAGQARLNAEGRAGRAGLLPAAARRSQRRRLGPILSPSAIASEVGPSARPPPPGSGVRAAGPHRPPSDHAGQARGRRGSRPGAASTSAPARSSVDRYRLNLLVPTIAPGAAPSAASAPRSICSRPSAAPRRPAGGSCRSTPLAGPTPRAGAALSSGAPGRRPGRAQPSSSRSTRRPARPRPIGPRDVFVATFWTTAELAVRIASWQADDVRPGARRSAYVIQDFEPGFYPMVRPVGARPGDVLAARFDGRRSSTRTPARGAFHAHGIRFDHEFAFEPRISASRCGRRCRSPAGPRRRTIVVYGRPRTPRNAFPAIVDGLRAWRASDPEAADWTVVSAGKPHPTSTSVAASGLRSLGKLDLDAYAELLRSRRSASR